MNREIYNTNIKIKTESKLEKDQEKRKYSSTLRTDHSIMMTVKCPEDKDATINIGASVKLYVSKPTELTNEAVSFLDLFLIFKSSIVTSINLPPVY